MSAGNPEAGESMGLVNVQVRHVALTPPRRAQPGCPNYGYRLERMDGTSLDLGLWAKFDGPDSVSAAARSRGWRIVRLLDAKGNRTKLPE